MREAGRPIPRPSAAAVSKRTIGVQDDVYQRLAEEASLQGLNVETMANAALSSGMFHLLERIKSVPPPAERALKTR